MSTHSDLQLLPYIRALQLTRYQLLIEKGYWICMHTPQMLLWSCSVNNMDWLYVLFQFIPNNATSQVQADLPRRSLSIGCKNRLCYSLTQCMRISQYFTTTVFTILIVQWIVLTFRPDFTLQGTEHNSTNKRTHCLNFSGCYDWVWMDKSSLLPFIYTAWIILKFDLFFLSCVPCFFYRSKRLSKLCWQTQNIWCIFHKVQVLFPISTDWTIAEEEKMAGFIGSMHFLSCVRTQTHRGYLTAQWATIFKTGERKTSQSSIVDVSVFSQVLLCQCFLSFWDVSASSAVGVSVSAVGVSVFPQLLECQCFLSCWSVSVSSAVGVSVFPQLLGCQCILSCWVSLFPQLLGCQYQLLGWQCFPSCWGISDSSSVGVWVFPQLLGCQCQLLGCQCFISCWSVSDSSAFGMWVFPQLLE